MLEATTTGNVRLIGIDPARIAELREEHPYYSVGEIPTGAYPRVDVAISTVSMMNWLVADQALSDEVEDGLLNILATDRVSLEQVHDMAEQIDLARLDEAPIPLHAAAERWRAGG